jgi:hypothetical protein
MENSPRRGGVPVDAPEEVVLALLRGRHAERGYAHAARIEAAGDVLDAAVLARAVAALQHHEDAAQLGAEHLVLQLEELLPELLEARRSLLARHALRRLGRDAVEADLLAGAVENARRHG